MNYKCIALRRHYVSVNSYMSIAQLKIAFKTSIIILLSLFLLFFCKSKIQGKCYLLYFSPCLGQHEEDRLEFSHTKSNIKILLVTITVTIQQLKTASYKHSPRSRVSDALSPYFSFIVYITSLTIYYFVNAWAGRGLR